MDDLVTKLLAAIDEEEQRARRDAGDEQHQQRMAECGDLNEGYIVDLALDRLRHCEADRRVVERHTAFHAFIPAALLDGPQSERWCTYCRNSRWPCPDLLDRAYAYGITTEARHERPA